jgi:colanic acid biosynthesis glycosyl transferase WcaI
MLASLRDKGVAGNCIYYLPNWVDTDATFPQPATSPMRSELGLSPSAAVVLYAGNLGEKQGLELLAEAARRTVESPDVEWVICGDGVARDRLRDMTKGLPNVRWLPIQPVERLNDLLNLADIHILPQRADAADLVMPSKLTGMLASGRPVIATANEGTELATVLAECGIVTRPGDVQGLVAAVLELARDSAQRQRLGAVGRRYAVERFGRNAVLANLERRLVGLVDGRLEGASTGSAAANVIVAGPEPVAGSVQAGARGGATTQPVLLNATASRDGGEQ